MEKGFFAFLLAVLLTVALSSCGISAPSEEALAEMIPISIIQYTIDGEFFTPKIESCTLIRRQTNGKEDCAECNIIVSDKNLVRKMVVAFNSTYYDVGGWQLDSCYVINEESPEILLHYDIDKLKDAIADSGYIPDEVYQVEDSAGDLLYFCSITPQEHKYLTLTGTVEAHTKLIRCETNDLVSLNYEWITDVFPDIQSQWNIDGSWYGEPLQYDPNNAAMVYYSGKPNPYYVSITDNTFDGEKCSGIIETKFDSNKGGTGTYKPQQYKSDVKIEGHSIDNIFLSFSAYGGGSNSFKIYFYADDAYITKTVGELSLSKEYLVPLKRI